MALPLKLDSLQCALISTVEVFWTFWFIFNVFGLIALKGFFRQWLAKCDELVGNIAE